MTDWYLWRLGKLSHELQLRLVGQAPSQPQKRFFEVVVAPRAEIVVLEIAFTVKLYVFGLDLPILHVDLVADEDDWNVLAHAADVSMPVWNILVGDAGRHVEHDDGALALDVIPVTQTAKFSCPC